MQRAHAKHPISSHGFDPACRFKVTIAYEDFEAGKQAKNTYDFLTRTMGNDCQFASQMWKFDVLTIPKLRELALGDGQVADILIIACSSGDLPQHVKNWVQEIFFGQPQVSALVALFHGDAEDSGAGHQTRAYLRSVARAAGIDFFAQPDDWTGQPLTDVSSVVVPEAQAQFHVALSGTPAGAGQRQWSAPRWGINE